MYNPWPNLTRWTSRTAWVQQHGIGQSHFEPPAQDLPLPAAQVDLLPLFYGPITDIVWEVEVGEGSFGKVWRVNVTKTARDAQGVLFTEYNYPLACKVIRLSNDPFHHFKPIVDRVNSMIRDVDVIEGLNHRNIMTIEHKIAVPDPVTDFPYSAVLLFMELCTGTLGDIIYGGITFWNGRLTPLSCKRWLAQVALGMEYLHQHKVAHMDIKPWNILFQFSDPTLPLTALNALSEIPDDMTFKVADFGLSLRFGPNEDMTANLKRGTTPYCAPEIMNLRGDMWREWAKPCDVYSLGVSVIHTYIGPVIFKTYTVDQLRSLVSSFAAMSQVWPVAHINANLIDLILEMTEELPDPRPTIEAIVANPWLQI